MRWFSQHVKHDQIYIKNLDTNTDTSMICNRDRSDSSDPFPITQNLIGFSFINKDKKYGLFMCNMNTGELTQLSATKNEQELGGNYINLDVITTYNLD